MNIVTAIPWHLYLTMVLFALTIGVLVVVELEDLRSDGDVNALRGDPSDRVDDASAGSLRGTTASTLASRQSP
jgi:hypothetical protein